MRLLFAGTPAVAAHCLEALLASTHEVVGVLTRPDAEAGRGRRATSSPVADLARVHGLPLLQPARLRDPGVVDELRELRPDVCPVVAYGALVPPDALAVPAIGWVNLHFSLLPAWRGAAPVQHALLHGDEVTGATTFVLDEGLDTGPVLGVVTEEVRPEDTSGALLERLAVSGAQLLVATLDGIASGEVRPVAQPAEGVSFAPKVLVDDARIRWEHPALQVHRRVRAMTPAPGAWTTFRERRIKLGPVGLDPTELALGPGELHVSKDDVLVGTGDRPVRLGTVQTEGKPAVAAADWARGARISAGERVG